MGISLKQHQYDAVQKMKNGCILCGDTGSGKSRTALAYYYIRQGGSLDSDSYVKMKNPKDLYVITTAMKRDSRDWEDEMLPFLISRDPEVSIYKHKVVVDSWNNIQKYKKVRGSFFIFDEQRVVGSGPWAKAFIEIARFNEWVLLSATPGDKWIDYIPVFIANGFYHSKTEFERNHIIYKPFRKYKDVDRYLNLGRLMRLRNSILVDMDFDRPAEQHHENVWVSYDAKQYRYISSTRWDPYNNKPIQNAAAFCYALRRLVNSDESRQVAVMELLEKHPKAIIFYNFDYELEILRNLGENFYPRLEIAEWNGHKHQPIPEGDRWIYLVNYIAGAEGWNCITTDTIIFYSQNYSYKVLVQASGRIDRMNTRFVDLYYYHLKSKSGIDLAINRAIKEKKKFIETRFFSAK